MCDVSQARSHPFRQYLYLICCFHDDEITVQWVPEEDVGLCILTSDSNTFHDQNLGCGGRTCPAGAECGSLSLRGHQVGQASLMTKASCVLQPFRGHSCRSQHVITWHMTDLMPPTLLSLAGLLEVHSSSCWTLMLSQFLLTPSDMTLSQNGWTFAGARRAYGLVGWKASPGPTLPLSSGGRHEFKCTGFQNLSQ